jgi:hypothetical protein
MPNFLSNNKTPHSHQNIFHNQSKSLKNERESTDVWQDKRAFRQREPTLLEGLPLSLLPGAVALGFEALHPLHRVMGHRVRITGVLKEESRELAPDGGAAQRPGNSWPIEWWSRTSLSRTLSDRARVTPPIGNRTQLY